MKFDFELLPEPKYQRRTQHHLLRATPSTNTSTTIFQQNSTETSSSYPNDPIDDSVTPQAA